MTNEEFESALEWATGSFYPNTLMSQSAFDEIVRLARLGRETEELQKKGQAVFYLNNFPKAKPNFHFTPEDFEDHEGEF